jgi:hypothetical protein
MNWKDVEGRGCGLIFRCYLGISLEGLRKTTKNLNQDRGYLSRDFSPGSPENEARPQRSVLLTLMFVYADENLLLKNKP